MSFEAKIALNGQYHQADVEVMSDSRRWPRYPKRQSQQEEVAETAEGKEKPEAEKGNDCDVKD